MGRFKQNIPPEDLVQVRELVLDKSRFSGGDLGRHFGFSGSSVFQWFSKTGIPPGRALEIADVMTSWAVELLESAGQLREQALRYARAYAALEQEGLVEPSSDEKEKTLRDAASGIT